MQTRPLIAKFPSSIEGVGRPGRHRVAAFLVALALAACVQGVADNRSYAPYAPENNGNMHDSGGGAGGGGGGM